LQKLIEDILIPAITLLSKIIVSAARDKAHAFNSSGEMFTRNNFKGLQKSQPCSGVVKPATGYKPNQLQQVYLS